MSEPTQTPATAADEHADRRKSLGKYVKRLSAVLRRGSSKDVVPRPASTAQPTPKEAPVVPKSIPHITPKPSAETPQNISPETGLPKVPGPYPKSTIQQERARAVFARYGLTLEAHEWVTAGVTTGTVQRVEKPIRMRVVRKCHKCDTTFGADRMCKSCEHRRCKTCPRWPPKKDAAGATEALVSKEREKKAKIMAEELVSEYKKRRRSNPPQVTLSNPNGGDLVYSPIRQRIRRTCHKCDNLFQPVTAVVCENCHHHRCTKCPRDPAKKNKWPDGYVGDVADSESEEDLPMINRTWKNPRQRVRWSCCTCESLFLDGLKLCACGHNRTDCQECTRTPPIRPKEEFPSELVAAVEEKLRLRFQLEGGVTSVDIPPPS